MSALAIASKIVNKLQGAGYISYFAGGWVRDFLMGLSSNDIDIATQASVEEVQHLFSKTIPIGVSFGIVIVVEEHHQFEVATFRRDQGYQDGRRPIGIAAADPKQDAARRDFTINGMFFDPIKREVIDYVKGRKDLKEGVIRAIGDPHTRFSEDRLRMMRAIRYATRFGFSIETNTSNALLDHAHSLLPSVAIERVWNELCKMAIHSHFDDALICLHRFHLLQVIFPTLSEVSTQQIRIRLRALSDFPDDAPVIAQVLELFPEATLKEKEELIAYMKLPNKDRDFVRFFDRFTHILKKIQTDRYQWAELYAHPSCAISLQIEGARLPLDERHNFFQEHASRMHKLEEPIKRIKVKAPYLTSEDLRKAGVPNGIKMGQLLKKGERIAINEQIEDPREIIDRLDIQNEL